MESSIFSAIAIHSREEEEKVHFFSLPRVPQQEIQETHLIFFQRESVTVEFTAFIEASISEKLSE